MPFVNAYVRCDVDGATAGLVEPLRYFGRDDDFTVPAGAVTDFASVPQCLTWLVPRMGLWTRASILHDAFCLDLERLDGHRRYPTVSARDADAILRRVCREAGVPLVRRWLIWTAVRIGALTTPVRRPDWWHDAPAVLGISLLAAPVLIPATVAVVVTLLVDRVVEGLIR